MSWRLGEETPPMVYRHKGDVMVKPIAMDGQGLEKWAPILHLPVASMNGRTPTKNRVPRLARI